MLAVGGEGVDRAGEGQPDGRDPPIPAHSPQAANAGVQLLQIEAVAGRADAADHRRRLRHGDPGVGGAGVGRGGSQHLVVGGAGVAQQEDLIPLQGEVGHLVGRRADLPPRRTAGLGGGGVGDLEPDLVLHARDHRAADQG